MVASAVIGAAVVGTAGSIYAADKAAGAQKRAARDAAAAQAQALTRQEELQEPFRQAGIAAQNRTLTLLGLEGGDTSSPDFGKYARDFSMSDFQADPGYGFRLKQGMKALEQSAAARGGLLSGSTLKGITQFGQDAASQEYLNAFNRYQANRSNQLNPLQSLYGGGQTATNALTGAYSQGATNMSNAMLAGGAAKASSYTGMASALNQGLSTGAGLAVQYPLYKSMVDYNTARTNALTAGGGGGGGLTYPSAPSYEAGWASTNWMM